MNYDWHHSFKQIYDKALAQYQKGNRNLESYFTDEEVKFLRSMGCKPIEVYDFAEDFPAIDWETALLITATRRAHFLFIEGALTLDYTISVEEFPARDDEVDGIPWLPRLILKAQAKLRGHLPKELMYCCGGDRAFFKKHDLHPADFLRLVWYAGDDYRKIVDVVKTHALAAAS